MTNSLPKIRKAAVLGSGVMGSGIAAHLANAGIPVLMLDILPRDLDPKTEDPKQRNAIALGALAGLAKSKPPLLYSQRGARLIEAGNLEDDFDRLAECDWIVEVVIERLDIKQALFERLDRVRRADAIVSSNTSGLSVAAMTEGRSEGFRQHFLVTHFFNPVRYMRLLELVPGQDTLPEVLDAMADFGRFRLGKGIVYGKDTPNFVANRLGIYGTAAAFQTMVDLDVQADELDAIAGIPMARPKSAFLDTTDVVGLDTMLHVMRTSREAVQAAVDAGQSSASSPLAGEEVSLYEVPPFVQAMADAGALGRKSGAGFYRLDRSGGQKTKLVLDWKSGDYRSVEKPDWPSLKASKKLHDPAERLRATVEADDRGGQLAWRLLRDTLVYSSHRLGEIADTIVDIDRGMRWGYSWDLGPFEAWDAVGVATAVERMRGEGVEPATWVAEMLDAGHTSFYSHSESGGREYYDPRDGAYHAEQRPDTFLALADCKRGAGGSKEGGKGVVWHNGGASLVDLGDGVACLEFHSRHQPRLNPIDDEIVEGLLRAPVLVEKGVLAEKGFDALVLHHGAENFCVGANLFAVLQLAREQKWNELEQAIATFQQATVGLRRAPVPVVVAPFGQTFGGGAEITLGGDLVCAHAETYMGLVEIGVGVVPGGGGHLFLLDRLLDEFSDPISENLHPLRRAFELIAKATVAASGVEARELGFLRRGDHVELNRDRQLWTAKRMARTAADLGYRPPLPRTFQLPGKKGAATLRMMLHNMRITGWISEYDEHIAGRIADILCGGDTTIAHPVSEQQILDLEREVFLSLCGEERTQARMEHMLKTGKPLRN